MRHVMRSKDFDKIYHNHIKMVHKIVSQSLVGEKEIERCIDRVFEAVVVNDELSKMDETEAMEWLFRITIKNIEKIQKNPIYRVKRRFNPREKRQIEASQYYQQMKKRDKAER